MMAKVTRRDAVLGAVAFAAVPRAALAFASSKTHDVQIQGFAFVPNSVQVQVGDIIRWTNEDLAPHTATADEFGWDTAALSQGASSAITVTQDMETSYFCVFHPQMKATIEIG
jgi:plastocyanin